jgi:L-threonylcarbamoyladenylate synthase
MSGPDIDAAVRILRQGGLVAFPTETVYGLGADVRRPESIARLYRVKGRPGHHPVIVHVASLEAARGCSTAFTPVAERLAARFWPGPLTLIVEKAAWVPDSVTGDQPSVGLRIPSHPLALRLLEAFGGALAAPSANRFGRVSPTTAEHVRADLGTDVDLVLDGGPCQVGVESTIVDARGDDPVILRPGGVTREALEAELGRAVPSRGESSLKVSGGLPSHYAPRAKVEVVEAKDVEAVAAAYRAKGLNVKMLRSSDVEAHDLYASLRKADEEGVDVIVAPRPSEQGLGRAVADRLKRASGPRS